MIYLVIFLSILVLVLLYSTIVNYRKVEIYENSINEFYSRTSIVLNSMRAIDSSKMFEEDDDVGTIFQQLVDMLGQLRPLIYGIPDGKNKED
jgi:hypothetical protein